MTLGVMTFETGMSLIQELKVQLRGLRGLKSLMKLRRLRGADSINSGLAMYLNNMPWNRGLGFSLLGSGCRFLELSNED